MSLKRGGDARPAATLPRRVRSNTAAQLIVTLPLAVMLLVCQRSITRHRRQHTQEVEAPGA